MSMAFPAPTFPPALCLWLFVPRFLGGAISGELAPLILIRHKTAPTMGLLLPVLASWPTLLSS